MPAEFVKRPSATPATSWTPRAKSTVSNYYIRMAKELERMGAHILAIKDMAGLLRPYAAERLSQSPTRIRRSTDSLPHARYQRHQRRLHPQSFRSRRERVRRRPRLHERHHKSAKPKFHRGGSRPHQPRYRPRHRRPQPLLRLLGNRSRLLSSRSIPARKTGSAEVYLHEMPGGQITNLKEQAEAMGSRPTMAGNRPNVRRREPRLRRHRQSHSLQQSRGRPRHLPDHSQHDRRGVRTTRDRTTSSPSPTPSSTCSKARSASLKADGPNTSAPSSCRAGKPKRPQLPDADLSQPISSLLYPDVYAKFHTSPRNLWRRRSSAVSPVLLRHGAGRRNHSHH